MIISHGPLGYGVAYLARRFWLKIKLTKKQERIIYIVGFIAGIFPDIDLFFYYFVSASFSHRQFISHSILPYLAILIVGLIILKLSKKKFVGVIIITTGLGTLSHLLIDSVLGLTALLTPISNKLFGLVLFDWFQTSIFMHFSLVTMFVIEILIIMAAGYTFIKNKKQYLYICATTFAILIIVPVYVNFHVFRPNGLFYYADYDDDGILNSNDLNIDGDGFDNIVDIDIDGDGEDNSLDIYRETFEAEGSLYDYTEGIFAEIPLRLGFVTTEKLIERMFANVGIFFGNEMTTDYELNSIGYIGNPSKNEFTENIDNWKNWLSHLNRMMPADTYLNEFDILFFESEHVGIFTRVDGEDRVLEADGIHFHTSQIPLEKVIKREGDIVSVGRLLPKPIDKQY